MTTWKEKMAQDAKHIRIPEIDNPTKAEENCQECNRLVREAFAELKMNVDAADRNSSSFVIAAREARTRCPIHGKKR